jgi:hypothetical protein
LATTTNLAEALKYTYHSNRAQYLFNAETVTYNLLSRNKKAIGGRGQNILPLIIRNAGAVTGISEGGSLPSALQPDAAEATYSLQEFVGVSDISWKLMQDASTDRFAFERALETVEDGMQRRFLRNLNSDLVDDGRGRLAVLPAADNDTTVTVAAVPRCEAGQVVDIMANSDDDTKRTDSATVTGVDPIALTVTLSANSGSTAAGDYLVIQDTTDVSVSATAYHANGLLSIIDSANPASVVGNYGGINRSTAGNEFWQGVELGNSGTNRPLTEDLGLQAQDGVRVKGGGMIDVWLSGLPILRRYHEMLSGERYFALSKPGVLEGGVGRKNVDPGDMGMTPYEFSGVTWYADPMFNANVMVGFNSKHFFLGHGANDVPQPLSKVFPGTPILRQTTSATFEVVWYFQMEPVCDFPSAGAKIVDIAES